MSHSKIIVLIVCLVSLTFANSLSNSFVGDDFLLFVGNSYYRDPHNAGRIFSPDFITTQEELSRSPAPGRLNNYSGCVAYRPVTALSYFLDFAVWKLNPHGLRFTNLLLHILNSVLVYWMLFLILRRKSAAGLAALLFGVHPIQAELLNNIGYRSDLLAVLFYCLTMIAFILYDENKKFCFCAGGLAAMILALLAKETAITLPAMLMVYHIIFVNTANAARAFRKHARLYILWWVIPGIYLYLYFFVFSNATLDVLNGPAVFEQAFLFFYMMGHTVWAVVWPLGVKVVPPFYAPALNPQMIVMLSVTGVLLAAAFCGIKLSLSKRGVFAFLILWFGSTYLPTSNIIPLVNPMGYRYLYLPSIGLFAILGMLTRWAAGFFENYKHYRLYRIIAKSTIVVACMMFTVQLNVKYKDNFTMHEAMRQSYPDSAYPYLILGTIYKELRMYPEAAAHYRQYIENKPESYLAGAIPGEYVAWHQIGTCYVNDPDKAIDAFTKAVKLKPDYAEGYASLGKAFLLKNNFPQALHFINEAFRFDGDLFSARVYLLQTYQAMGEIPKARAVLTDLLEVYPAEGILLEFKQKIMP